MKNFKAVAFVSIAIIPHMLFGMVDEEKYNATNTDIKKEALPTPQLSQKSSAADVLECTKPDKPEPVKPNKVLDLDSFRKSIDETERYCNKVTDSIGRFEKKKIYWHACESEAKGESGIIEKQASLNEIKTELKAQENSNTDTKQLYDWCNTLIKRVNELLEQFKDAKPLYPDWGD